MTYYRYSEQDKKYVKQVYDIVAAETEGLEAVYGNFIRHLVGIVGLETLVYHNLIESCGVVNGKQLYTLIKKGS